MGKATNNLVIVAFSLARVNDEIRVDSNPYIQAPAQIRKVKSLKSSENGHLFQHRQPFGVPAFALDHVNGAKGSNVVNARQIKFGNALGSRRHQNCRRSIFYI